MLKAISPVDGRYANKVDKLSNYFSEFALIKYRVLIEVHYFLALTEISLDGLSGISQPQIDELIRLTNRFDLEEAEKVKQIEKITNHDVKAVEYYLKEKFDQIGLSKYKEYIHFGLTSQDINNTAIPLSIKHALEHQFLGSIEPVIQSLFQLSEVTDNVAMLARTHGQPASPTTLGKEIMVFIERLKVQVEVLKSVPINGKFSGATGNFNAHQVAFPNIDWPGFADKFINDKLGLVRSHPTTQIEHYDNLGRLFQAIKRINTILIDLCRDFWTYISLDYFGQKVIKGEVGSSAMPHKVNPIDFENGEGNLGIANALFTHLADKLPISRLQRDLTDSTVMRNIGVPFAHSMIAYQSILKGLSKVLINPSKIDADLEANWMVLAEAIQSVLRKEGYQEPYEALKALTRGNRQIGKTEIHEFVHSLEVSETVKTTLLNLTPQNYIGVKDY